MNQYRASRMPTPTILALAMGLLAGTVAANPNGGSVVVGNATIAQQGRVLTVTSTTAKSAIDWQAFSIAADEITRFVQPSSDSSVLNRVVGVEPSLLLGGLESNGRVFLINPAGILVGEGARIDVGSLVASSLHLDLDDFLADRFAFRHTPNAGPVENRGHIRSASGGSIFLVAPEVRNHGVIEAPRGEVILAAGDRVSLVDTATPGVRVEIDAAPGEVTNLGRVLAEAGTVGIAGALVRNSGTVSADSVVRQGGRVFLSAGDSLRNDDGAVISADGVAGGRVEVEAGALMAAGTLSADGATDGGDIRVEVGRAVHAGRIEARGDSGRGGRIELEVEGDAIHNLHSTLDSGGAVGGQIREVAGGQLTSSARYMASGTGGAGGNVDLSAPTTRLLSAEVDVRGATAGGEIRLGGGRDLVADALANADRLLVSPGTVLRADAAGDGPGGSVILWSERQSLLFPEVSVRGGAGQAGGFVELSSAGALSWGGRVEAGPGGEVLLDPANIVIANGEPGGFDFGLLLGYDNVALDAGDNFGSAVAIDGDRLVVGASSDGGLGNVGNAFGAVYLFSNVSSAPALTGIIGKGYTGTGNLDLAQLDEFDQFGFAVDLRDNLMAVGAPGDGGRLNTVVDGGAVYLVSFTDLALNGAQLVGTAGLDYTGANDIEVPDLRFANAFGVSVALNAAADRMAVGERGGELERGPVRLFSFADSAFSAGQLALTIGEDADFTISPLPQGFGSGVAFNGSGDRLAIGAPGDRGVSGTELWMGAVYLLGFDDNSFANPQILALLGNGYAGISSDLGLALDAGDSFGAGLALDDAGTLLAVGAPGDDGNGNEFANAGAVYLIGFDDVDFTAGQIEGQLGTGYPGSPPLGLAIQDDFGSSVSLDAAGDRLAVGAPGDDGFDDSRGRSGAVYLFARSGGDVPATGQTFAANPDADVTITPASITAILEAGTALTLQANNDITVDEAVVVDNPAGDGGDLTLQAGRSIHVNADIVTDNGNLVFVANDENAVAAWRETGLASVMVAAGAGVDTGSGTLDMQFGSFAAGGSFRNAGTLDIGGGVFDGPNFVNTGTVNLNAGTLGIDIGGNSTDSGTYNLAAGTQLVVNSSLFRALGAGGVIAGDGQLLLESGQFTIVAGSNYAVATRITGGLFNVSEASTVIPSLELAGNGLFGGGADVTVGDFSWTGGTPVGNRLLTTTGNTVIGGTGTRSLQRNWLNTGMVSLADAASLQLTAGHTLTNAAGAVFALDGSANATSLGVFDNQGVFNKNSPGAQNFGNGLGSFVNSGTVNVLAGELGLAGSGVDSGTYAIASGSTLRFRGGTRELAAGSAIGGAGNLALAGGSIDLNGDLNVAGTVSVEGATVNLDTPAMGLDLPAGLVLSGGSLATADAIVTPNLAWSGGSLSGSGTLETTSAGSSIGPSGTRLLQIDWLNSGAVSLEGSAVLSISGGSTLRNTGQFTLAGTGGVATADSGTLLNEGTLTKDSAFTQSIALTTFANTGTVEISNGRLNIDADGADTGLYEIAAPATLAFVGGDRSISANGIATFTGTDALRGQGTVRLLGGTLTFAGGGVTDSATALDLVVDLGPIVPGTITQPANGSVVDNGDGSFTYTPDGLFAGTDSFSFVVEDGAGNQRLATIDIDVTLGDLLATWIGSTGGAWEDPANWQDGRVPGAGFRVEIPDFAGQITVTYSAASGTTELRSLESFESLRLIGGTLGLGFDVEDLSLIGPDATLSIEAGTLAGAGTLTVEGALQQTGGSQAGTGTTVIEAGATASLGDADVLRALVNRGMLALADTTFAADLVNAGELVIDGNVSIPGGLRQTAGSTSVGIDGTLTLGGTGLSLAGGRIDGDGRLLGDVDNSGGVVAPGASPGTLSISGNYVQGPGGTLAMEVGGLSTGLDSDLLDVGDSAVLDGTLSVSLINGFAPVADDLLTLIQAAEGVTGTFATTVYPAGYVGTPQYGSNAFALSLAANVPSDPTLPAAIVAVDWAAGGPYAGVRPVPVKRLLEAMQARGLLDDVASLWIPGDSPFAAGWQAVVAAPGAGSGGSGAGVATAFVTEDAQRPRGRDLPVRGIVPFPLFYGVGPDVADDPDIQRSGPPRRPVGFCTVGGA